MSNNVTWPQFSRWWLAFVGVGAVGLISTITVKQEFLNQRDVFALFLSLLLVGIGEWINHPPLRIEYTPTLNDPPVRTVPLSRRSPSVIGNAVAVVGVVIFTIAVVRVLFFTQNVEPNGPANRDQPIQLGTNSTPLPAGPGR